MLNMTLQCSHCSESFLSNHALYKHKSLAHPKNSLLSNDELHPTKRPADGGGYESSKYRKIDSITLPSVVVNEPDMPDEKLTDLVSNPELLSMVNPPSPNHAQGNKRYIATSENSNDGLHTGIGEDKSWNGIDRNKSISSDVESGLVVKYEAKICQVREYYNKSIDELKTDHLKQLSEYEKGCEVNIKRLNNQIQALKDGEEDAGDLTMTIFNFSAIGEILKIQRLIKNRQMNDVLQNHLPALKNILLGLTSGVLPLCQPQRSKVTNQHRVLVEQLQSASKTSAKHIFQEKEADIINLFEIVKETLKLAARSFNRFCTF